MDTSKPTDYRVRCPNDPCGACRTAFNRIIRTVSRRTFTQNVSATTVQCVDCRHEMVLEHATPTLLGRALSWLTKRLPSNPVSRTANATNRRSTGSGRRLTAPQMRG